MWLGKRIQMICIHTSNSKALQGKPIVFLLEAFLKDVINPVRLVLVPFEDRRVQVFYGVEMDKPVRLSLARTKCRDLECNWL